MDLNRTDKSLTSAQKTGFVLLLFFGLLAVGLGFLQLRNVIYNPFALQLSNSGNTDGLFSDPEARLKSIDTDHDGLNDWEELTFYQTSPYLFDTDSDGIGDKQEIEQSTNPLCAKGEACESAQAIPNLPIEPMTSPVGQIITPEDILKKAGLTGPEGDQLSNMVFTLSDPKKVRQMLIKSGGISEEQLNKIDDAALMQMVNELLAGATGTSTILFNAVTTLSGGNEGNLLPTAGQ